MPNENEKGLSVDAPTKISFDYIYNLIVSALEGGSNYWYMIIKETKPSNFDNYKDLASDGEPFMQTYPLNIGGGLWIDDSRADEPKLAKPVKLDLALCKKGLKIMAAEYPKHFADVISENADAITGDVFLQCCILGEVIYG